VTTTSSSSLHGFNPFDPETLQCPWPHYAEMRATEPVFFVEPLNVYMVTRHDLVLDVIRDTEKFSSRFPGAAMITDPDLVGRLRAVYEDGYPRVPTMLTADAPEHTRYRKLVSKAFTPKVINELEPTVREISVRLIDQMAGSTSIEFVEEFAVPLPVEVIARALNVPPADMADFKRWSDDAIAGIGTNSSSDEMVDAARGVVEFQHYFADQLEQRRSEPRDDLLTNLLNARVNPQDDPDIDPRPLDMAEMLSIIQQLLVAGNETTTKMLTEMMLLIGRSPDQWGQLRADPECARGIVEETLRLATPTQGMWRIVTKDTTLAGVDIPEGARVIAAFCSANRDESLFEEPDRFDPDRENVREHLAFGKGAHYCIGANLSRLEGRVALEELSRRIESFRLSATNEFEYLPSFLLRGLIRLDLDVSFEA
jgi:cytochrome P450